MHGLLPWSVLVWALSACVSAPTGGGGGVVVGGGGSSQPVPSGGAVGANCPKQDQIGCAPNGLEKVRCKAGVWTSDGACTAPRGCIETKSGADVVATDCQLPPTERVDDAIVCAKAAYCLYGSFQSCMVPPSAQALKATGQLAGYLKPEKLILLSVPKHAACIKTATSCEQVRACVSSAGGTCSGGADSGSCQGSVASYCDEGTSFAVDCAQAGLACSELTVESKKMAMCGTFSPCATPKTLTCAGNVTKSCVKLTDTSNVAISIDCGVVGATCDPNAKFDDDPDVCRYTNGADCDANTFTKSCTGNVLSSCSKGKVATVDCTKLGLACAVEKSIDGLVVDADCTPYPACGLSIPAATSNPTREEFCNGPNGLASFDCALAGMIFDGNNCVFSPL